MSTKEKSPTLVVTKTARLSYANLFVPTAMKDDQEKKYNVAVLIPKSDKETVAAIKAAIKAATELGMTKDWGGKLPKMDPVLHDGDEEKPGDDAYAGHYYMNAKSKTPPQIVEKVNGVFVSITDQSKVYSGCYARVSMNVYPFAVPGNKGLAVGLNNVQFLKDGEPLAGRSTAESDFDDDFEDDDDL